jgi:hypothetical protein
MRRRLYCIELKSLSFIKGGEMLQKNFMLLEENALKMISGTILQSPDQLLGVYYEFVSLE